MADAVAPGTGGEETGRADVEAVDGVQAVEGVEVPADVEVVEGAEAAGAPVEQTTVPAAVAAGAAVAAAAQPPLETPTRPVAAFADPVAAPPAFPGPDDSLTPPQSPVKPTVRIAGREFDRRAALIAGGVGVVAVGGAVAAFASGGSGGAAPSTAAGGSTAKGAGTGSAKPSAPAAYPAAKIATVPADGASGVDPSKPVTVTVADGTIASVSLSGQQQTNGTLSTDGSTWTCDNVLSVDTSYQLTVTAKNQGGKTTTSTVSFRTLSPSAAFGVSSVVPPRGSTVGVGQPIRVTFSNYVPTEYHAALEKACVVTTDPPVAGAWYWVSNGTGGAVLDWRPQDFWATGTKVTIDFQLNGVRLGEHQFGVKDYAPHDFAIRDTDLRLIVDKDKFSATCYQDGKVIREFPIDTGMTTEETFVTYTGTMAVLGKGNPVEMKGNYGPGDTYDDLVNWATQITWTGTYVHAAPWDSDIGRANDDSHGCVHCRTADAQWFYGLAQPGDVVTISGSRQRPVAVDNGICTFTLSWPALLQGSAYGPTLNGKPVSA